MTKKKQKEKRVHEYHAPSLAVRQALEKLLEGKEPKIPIICEAYNAVAWKLINYARPAATKKQAIGECEEISKAAWKLVDLINKASSTTFTAIDGQTVSLTPGPMRALSFDLKRIHIGLAELIQATGQAAEAIAMDAGEGTRQSGIEPALVDEIANMIAADYWRATMEAPRLIVALGHEKPTGKYAEFFAHIFTSIFRSRDWHDPARKAAARWKETNEALHMKK
jgi:hypothetical protein